MIQISAFLISISTTLNSVIPCIVGFILNDYLKWSQHTWQLYFAYKVPCRFAFPFLRASGKPLEDIVCLVLSFHLNISGMLPDSEEV